MTIIFKLLLTYIAMSLTAGMVVAAFGYEIFAARWLYTPPVGLIVACGVFLLYAFVWWG